MIILNLSLLNTERKLKLSSLPCCQYRGCEWWLRIEEASPDRCGCQSLVKCVRKLPSRRQHPNQASKARYAAFFLFSLHGVTGKANMTITQSNDFCKYKGVLSPSLSCFLPLETLCPRQRVRNMPRGSLLTLLLWSGDTATLNVNCYSYYPTKEEPTGMLSESTIQNVNHYRTNEYCVQDI